MDWERFRVRVEGECERDNRRCLRDILVNVAKEEVGRVKKGRRRKEKIRRGGRRVRTTTIG